MSVINGTYRMFKAERFVEKVFDPPSGKPVPPISFHPAFQETMRASHGIAPGTCSTISAARGHSRYVVCRYGVITKAIHGFIVRPQGIEHAPHLKVSYRPLCGAGGAQ